jgi:hypothetical protein
MRYRFTFVLWIYAAAFAWAQQPDSTGRGAVHAPDTAYRTTPPSGAEQADSAAAPSVPSAPSKDTSKTTAAPPAAPTPPSDTVKKTQWIVTNMARLNMAQTGFFNWSAGGDNSLATNAFFTFTANYKNKNWAWDTKFDTEFGLVYMTKEAPESGEWKKSADKIHLSTTFGYTHNDKLYYSFLGELKTQYALSNFKGDYMSTFMAPAYLNLGLGADYKKTEQFSLFGVSIKDFTAFVSPFIARFTFVLNKKLAQTGAFGVDAGKYVKEQMGMGAKVSFKMDLMENVQMGTTLNLFTPYVDDFLNFVVDWDMVVHMKINKYLTTTLNMSLKYDEKIQAVDKNGASTGPRVQFKEILGIGVIYSF